MLLITFVYLCFVIFQDGEEFMLDYFQIEI